MTLDMQATIRLTLDPGEILRAQGIEPDPWQTEFLLCPAQHILLNCCRGAGKSRTTSARAIHTALFRPRSLTLLISRAQRQAQELYRYCKQGFRAIGWPVKPRKETETQLELENGSRIVSLPGKEATIRSYQAVDLLIIDEAAKVGDDLYASVSPMTAISAGQQVLLSTPFGQRGFFWREWTDERGPWTRFRVPWNRCPRHTQNHIDEERRKFGDAWVEQEYECSFSSLEGLVYPEFGDSLVDCWPLVQGRAVGGIDWGWHNPFAAVWGVIDRDDVLWIGWERYERQIALPEHITAIEARGGKSLCPPAKRVEWYADPSGPEWITACRRAGWKVLKGANDIRMGIMAVTERIRTGRLKVLRGACNNLIAESQLYRYPTKAERAQLGENPIDEHNHALAALRYLVASVDRRKISRRKGAEKAGQDEPNAAPNPQETARSVYNTRPWFRDNDESLWETL
jgi:hypothetical protein